MAVPQRSFSGGILSPLLRGRADQQKYLTGVRTLLNFLPIAAGPAVNRPGFEWMGEVKDSAAGAPRLVPFVFNSDQTYVLEMGTSYGRVWRNGARINVSGVAAWNIATAYVLGDLVSRLGVNYYCSSANTGNQPPNAAFWRALSGAIYEFVAPYDLPSTGRLHYAQSADVITVAEQGYGPREIQRTADTHWVVAVISFGAGILPPTGPAATAGTPTGGGGGAQTPANPTISSTVGGNAVLPKDQYVITTWNGLSDAPEIYESTGSPVGTSTVGGADAGNHVVITWAAGGVGQTAFSVYKLFFPYYRRIADVAGTVLTYTDVGVADPGAGARQAPTGPSSVNTFSYVITSVDDISGAESIASAAATCTGAIPTALAPNSVLWNSVTGSTQYNVYRVVDGTAGYIGTATGTGVVTFHDPGITPDTGVRPPTNPVTFDGVYDHPATCSYHQQRLGFANTVNDPDTVWLSTIGNFHDFSVATPLEEDSAFKFQLAGTQVNEVRHLVSLNDLFLFTSGGEFTAAGNQEGTLTPASPNVRQKGSRGASTVAPIAVDGTALFVQARGSVVRDLIYDWQSNGYKGRDLTIFSPHLFESQTIVDWAYQQMPNSVVWAVRDDGVLLSLTYVREQEVWGWAEHTTDGTDTFERVVSVPEGTEDAVYVVVKRTINGATKRYIERLHTRIVTDVTVDAFFVDSGLTYDGRNTGATTLTITGGTTWAYTELLTVLASAATFDVSDIGKAFAVTVGGVTVTVVITAYTDTTHVQGFAQIDVPAAARGVASAVWARAVKVVTGVDHLEGRGVSALVDGAAQTGLTVAAGSVTLDRFGSVIHVGLPIVADIGSLDWEDPQRGTQIDKRKRINQVTVMVEGTRGISVGEDADHLTLYKHRIDESPGDATYLLSANINIPIKASWNTGGRVYLRQTDPLPVSVLAVAITGQVSE